MRLPQEPIANIHGLDGVSIPYRDGRTPISQLYQSYEHLLRGAEGIGLDVVYVQEFALPGGFPVRLPIFALRSPAQGHALWLLSGIHGEEPAGPVAIAQNSQLLGQLAASQIPFVVLPLCNPKGYLLDWRYPNIRRQEDGDGASVGDCTHLLPNAEDPARPRRPGGPACPEAGALSGYLLSRLDDYPPLLSLDLHEDEAAEPSEAYVYSQGERGPRDPVALEIVSLLERGGFTVPHRGMTSFGEPIVDGVVATTRDGSIDEMISSRVVLRDGQAIRGPRAGTVIVVETPAGAVSLDKRVAAHAEILRTLPRWYYVVRQRGCRALWDG